MEERSLVGLEARAADGTEVGRITEVISDEASGEVTHVVVEREEEEFEVPVSSLSLEPETDFAIFHADPSDAKPGEHQGDGAGPQGYAPAESDQEDYRHEGQLVTGPEDPAEMMSPEVLDSEPAEAGGWEDEASNTPESGYPRNDAYIDPETGETTEGYPEAGDARGLEAALGLVLEDTGLRAASISDGVVELAGSAPDSAELDRVAARITALEEVFEVDTAAVDVG